MWNRTNTEWYQAVVTENLSNIYLPLDALYCNNNDCSCHHLQIERYYRDIVQCLKLAEITCVPVCKVGFHKHCWSPKLDDMKQQCIDITNLWTSVGRPQCGTINVGRLYCKFWYKQVIKEAASEADKDMNDDLFNHLCDKDNVSFWKSWRKRSRSVQPTNVLNGKSGANILPEFTNFDKEVFQPNTAHANAKFKVEIETVLADRLLHKSTPAPVIDTSYLAYYIHKLKRGKAAGIDKVVNEHVLFGGPYLVVHLCLLFNCMLKHAYVPAKFC